MHLNALSETLNLLLHLLQRILPARCENELQVVWLRAREFQRRALSDPRASTRYEDGLAREPLCLGGTHSLERGGEVELGAWEGGCEGAVEGVSAADKGSCAERSHVRYRTFQRSNCVLKRDVALDRQNRGYSRCGVQSYLPAKSGP